MKIQNSVVALNSERSYFSYQDTSVILNTDSTRIRSDKTSVQAEQEKEASLGVLAEESYKVDLGQEKTQKHKPGILEGLNARRLKDKVSGSGKSLSHLPVDKELTLLEMILQLLSDKGDEKACEKLRSLRKQFSASAQCNQAVQVDMQSMSIAAAAQRQAASSSPARPMDYTYTSSSIIIASPPALRRYTCMLAILMPLRARAPVTEAIIPGASK